MNTHEKISEAAVLRQQVKELLISNKELVFQNEEKEKRAAELIIANKKLAFQQDNLRKIASLVPGLVYQYLLRPDGTSCFPYASEAIREIFRVCPDEVHEDASKVFAICHPDDLAGVVASIQLSAQNLTPWQQEFRVKFDDGTIRSLYGNAVPQKEADVSVLWHGFITDITKRKRIEDELRISEGRYRLLGEHSRDVIWTMNLDGKITYFSRAVEQVAGFTGEEAMNLPLDKITTPDSLAIVVGYLQSQTSAFESGLPLENFRGELEFYRKDGSIYWAEVIVCPILGSDGSSITVLGVTRDINERKMAEETLKDREEQFRNLFVHAPVGIFHSNWDGHFLTANPALAKMLGFSSPEELILAITNMTTQIYEDPAIRPQIMNALRNTDGWVHYDEVNWLHKDKSVITVDMTGRKVLDSKGNFAYLEGFIEDITERMKSEAALKKAKANAEAATKSKSTFLANMSHEIRTPLNAIIGFSQLMNREELLTDRQKEYNTSIYRAGEHLLNLINDILELSKMEAGRVELKPTYFDPNVLLNDVQMMFKEQAQSKQLQLIVETSLDLPHHIFADDHKLRQILINLTGNATKFTHFGSVVIRAGVDRENKEKSRLIVEIQDSGPGMSEDEQCKLFKKFEQTAAGINSNSGTGLGLALSRELAMLMGGNITVTSEKGKGSVFTVNVEIREGEPEVRESLSTKRVTGIDNPMDDYRILVVDDKKDNRQVMLSFLRLAGFETEEAVDGKDAIAKFEQWNPHLILMDMRMPVMDGYEATRHIKSTEKGKQTPVIAVTASSLEDEKINVLRLDIQGYIPKPFHESELFETIGRVLGINYIYEEKITAATSKYLSNDGILDEDLAKLSEDLVLQMKHAVETADFNRLNYQIRSIENDFPELSRHLMTQANDFNYKYLLQVLKTSKK